MRTILRKLERYERKFSILTILSNGFEFEFANLCESVRNMKKSILCIFNRFP